MPIKDLTGKRFGRLVVKSFAYSKDYRSFWNCKCDCGNECIIKGKYLLNGDTKSCGCLNLDRVREMGLSNKTFNNYEEIDNGVVKVYFNNTPNYFICDINDWDYLKFVTWHESQYGYARGEYNGRLTMFHDIILNINTDDINNGIVCDHINRNRLDNRRCNLRRVTVAENACNKNSYSNNTSGYTGVHIRDGRFNVVVGDKYIGTYNTVTQARYVRIINEREVFGINPNLKQMYTLVDNKESADKMQ